ncbi:MAG: hypothetical protein HGA67_03050 [Candidatus Yonathbacteria bacterium]|nr:hypothetical protein [Candidatus Yonathbacteria bacterium]NTV44649.1 hypothetical protein [Candidatus Yonathbacteria bacterium]
MVTKQDIFEDYKCAYWKASKGRKHAIIDAICAVTGMPRKLVVRRFRRMQTKDSLAQSCARGRPVQLDCRQALAFRWILEAARKKKGSPMSTRLANELIAASKEEGEAIAKRDNVHKMAEANKAFAHFAQN